MGYDNMDHADWVERNIEAAKHGKPSASDRRTANQGVGWFGAPDKLNPFQRRAFTILGIIGGGIYNAPISWNTLYWRPNFLCLSWRGEFSTYDYSALTSAVFLAHDAAIRLSISSKSPGYLQIMLHQRTPKTDDERLNEGHPTLHAAIVKHRARFPEKHHIHYSEPAPVEPETVTS